MPSRKSRGLRGAQSARDWEGSSCRTSEATASRCHQRLGRTPSVRSVAPSRVPPSTSTAKRSTGVREDESSQRLPGSGALARSGSLSTRSGGRSGGCAPIRAQSCHHPAETRRRGRREPSLHPGSPLCRRVRRQPAPTGRQDSPPPPAGYRCAGDFAQRLGPARGRVGDEHDVEAHVARTRRPSPPVDARLAGEDGHIRRVHDQDCSISKQPARAFPSCDRLFQNVGRLVSALTVAHVDDHVGVAPFGDLLEQDGLTGTEASVDDIERRRREQEIEYTLSRGRGASTGTARPEPRPPHRRTKQA